MGPRFAWIAAAVGAVATIAADASAQRQPIPDRAGDPYTGAIVIDAGSGEVLMEDRADAIGYPASVIKLMGLLVILDEIRAGSLRMDDLVPVTREAMKMGGSQVYLDERESFPVEELLYALMIQSANDAAVALAVQVAGSKEAFVDRMNRKARALGMNHTRFHSVHGLPPSVGQQPDISTARDLAQLGRAVVQYPEALRFTSTQERAFRDGRFIMRTHNALLKNVPGCDGLKTGYFRAAGYSIAATAERDDRRIVTVVLGSRSRQARDAKAEVRTPGETGQDSGANRTGIRFETGHDTGMKPDRNPGNNRTGVRDPGMLSGMGRNVPPRGGSTLDQRAKGSPVERRSAWPERSDPCVRFSECCSSVMNTG